MRNCMILLTVLLFPLLSVAEKLPELGDGLPPSAKRKPHTRMKTSVDSMDDVYQIAVSNITFALAVDTSNRVVHVSTKSAKYTTSDGVRIGSTLSEVRAVPNATETTKPNGAYFYRLASGWNAVFAHGTKHSKAPVPKDAKVKFLFKSKYEKASGQQGPGE